MKNRRGFTLIELLIALMIFSLVSVAALASLNHMMRAREQQVMYHDANEKLDLAYAHLFQDMIWFVGDVSAQRNQLRFSRTQTTQTDPLLEITYILKDGQLFRSADTQSVKQEVLLLEDVQNLRLSWMFENKQWVGVFDQDALDQSPLLLRIQFDVPHIGEVTWVFATPHL